jgi:hypothetical protein
MLSDAPAADSEGGTESWGHGEGMQGVILNLRLDTAEARALGVETHVCELQLLLMSPEVPVSGEDSCAVGDQRVSVDGRTERVRGGAARRVSD